MSRSRGCRWVTSRSPIVIVPDVTVSSPASMRSDVDLPQPDGPTSTVNEPSGSSRSRSLTTEVFPYALVTPEKRTCAMNTFLELHRAAADALHQPALDEEARHDDGN